MEILSRLPGKYAELPGGSEVFAACKEEEMPLKSGVGRVRDTAFEPGLKRPGTYIFDKSQNNGYLPRRL